MAEPLRVGIIGYGTRGAVHAEVWAGLAGEAELAAIAEPNPERWQIAFDRHGRNGCQVYESGETLFREIARGKAAPLDITVVATQAPEHCANVLEAVRQGAHVICEKPIALTLEEADRMVEAADAAGVKFAVHFQGIFSKAVARAGELIADGVIGELVEIHSWCKGRPAPYDLMEVGGHVLQLMGHFAGGRPYEVLGDGVCQGRELRRSDARPVAELHPEGRDMGIGAGEHLFGRFRFTTGIRGNLTLMTVPAALRNTQYMTTELWGTRARLRFQHSATGRLFIKPAPHDDFSKTIVPWEEVDPALWENDPSWRGPTRRLAQDFMAAVREDRPPKVSGEDGRLVLEMAVGIYASHIAGQWLTLPLAERKHPLA